MYAFATLDPRPGLVSVEVNDRVFSSGPVYGVEVMVPALVERCIANLDPQYTGRNSDRAAIEDALEVALPPEGVIIATTCPNLDSVGSMAIFNLRMKGKNLAPALDQVKRVADSVKLARKGWAPYPLPAAEEPWSEAWDLAAIEIAVENRWISMTRRVFWMERWLLKGEEPAGYRYRVAKVRRVLISALESGEITYRTASNDRIAVIESIYSEVTDVGYALAPVVVACNPTVQMELHSSFTICQYSDGFVDLKSALAELNELEPGWLASPTVGSSPPGVRSKLTTDQVIEVVGRHFL